MIRQFFEFLVSRVIDSRKPLPGWLRGIVARDTQLREFETQAVQVDAALRQTAKEERSAMASVTTTTTADVPTLTLPSERLASGSRQHARRNSRWLTFAAAAAVLLIMLSSNWFRPNAPSVHAGEFSHQLTTVPGQVLGILNRMAQTSQTHLPRLSPVKNFSLPELPTWRDFTTQVETPVYQRLDSLQENWQGLKLRLPATEEE